MCNQPPPSQSRGRVGIAMEMNWGFTLLLSLCTVPENFLWLHTHTHTKHGRIQRGGQGVWTPPPPGIARLLIFAMLRFSVRPLLGIWTPPPPLRKFSGSTHAKHCNENLKLCKENKQCFYQITDPTVQSY